MSSPKKFSTTALSRQFPFRLMLCRIPFARSNTLAAAFNDAQAQLAGQLERERAFTRAAAHELKTPLAILRTHAEALQEDIAPEKRE